MPATRNSGVPFEPSANRRQLKNWFPKGDGAGYTVLYQEGNSATLYLNDENRRLNASRDRLIWVAIFESRDRFRWRIYSQPSNRKVEDRRARIRCPNR